MLAKILFFYAESKLSGPANLAETKKSWIDYKATALDEHDISSAKHPITLVVAIY